MHVDEALRTRISVREFLETPVPEATVREILDVARWSPSGGNLQPWKVHVVSGAAKDACTELAMNVLWEQPEGEADEAPIYPPKLWEPYRTRRYVLGEQMYALLGIPREDKPARLRRVARNFEFFGAPVGMFFIIDRNMGRGQWAHLGMFMQSVALAATARGLSTCMQESWAQVRRSLHGHFGLAEEELLYAGMALGHADPEAAVNTLRSERVEVEEFATFDGFDDG
jgi:nitroreductase